MTDTLRVFGQTFTGVTGIKAEDNNGNVLTFTRGGGGGGGSFDWIQGGAEFVTKAYDWTGTLDDTSYSSWTPSTTSTIILAGQSVSPITGLDFEQYGYFFLQRYFSTTAFVSGATLKTTVLNSFYTAVVSRSVGANTPEKFTNGVYNSVSQATAASVYGVFYYNSAGSLTFYVGNYGPMFINGTPSVSQSGDLDDATVSLTTPTIRAQCNATYFSTTRAAEVDTTHTTGRLRIDVFRAPLPSTRTKLNMFISDMVNGRSWDFA